jgi:hypothetical protein
MQTRSTLRSSLLFSCLATLALSSGAALAAGGGSGGGHFGGGGGGWHGAGGGWHGAGGGWHGGGAGWHGGGWHGDRGWHGGFGWRGWGWGGLGLGLYFSTLPLYYSTFWWGGIPYYYADNTYYQYDGTVGQYETVTPPPEVQKQAGAEAPVGTDLIAYPKNGQTTDQQANDKNECHQWAATQSGFDPAQGATASGTKRTDYMRAQAACLDGRGYSVQ